MASTLPLQTPAQPRSATTTALAWLVILASVALVPISFITLLMVIAGSYGTASATLFGFLTVVVAPPVTLVAGIGLLRRKPWARYYLLALFGVILAYNLYDLSRATPEPSHYVSPSGVPTTVLPTDRTMFVPIIVVCFGALAVLLSRGVRLEFSATPSTSVADTTATLAMAGESPNRRVGHDGRARMHRGDSSRGEVHGASVATSAPRRLRPGLAALLAVTTLLALAGGMGWLVYDGVGTGETVFPSKSPSQRRSVLRADEPILFWVSIGLYSTVALGAVGLVGWGLAQTRRNR